jgi:hypothetical protein
MSKFDIIGEASHTVAEFIYRGRHNSFFRMSWQTSEGNLVDVWTVYVKEDGRQTTEYRWRVLGNFDQVGDKDIIIAKGKVIENSPQYNAIIAAFKEEEFLSNRVKYLERQIEEINSGDLTRERKIDNLDMGRIE